MAGKPSLRADCERQRKLIDHISLIEIPAIPSLKKFAVFRVRGMPVEERLSSELPNLLQNSYHKEVIFHEILS